MSKNKNIYKMTGDYGTLMNFIEGITEEIQSQNNSDDIKSLNVQPIIGETCTSYVAPSKIEIMSINKFNDSLKKYNKKHNKNDEAINEKLDTLLNKDTDKSNLMFFDINKKLDNILSQIHGIDDSICDNHSDNNDSLSHIIRMLDYVSGINEDDESTIKSINEIGKDISDMTIRMAKLDDTINKLLSIIDLLISNKSADNTNKKNDITKKSKGSEN